MATDIARVDSGRPINVNKAICSCQPTGEYAELVGTSGIPADLTIANIESKYDARFDDINYYTLNGEVLGP